MYDKLTTIGIKVWWDQKCLKFGQPWDEGFIDGLCKSRIFVPIYSRGAINDDAAVRQNITKLTIDSPVDNFLLEQHIAIELRKRNLIELISPIMVGDFDTQTDSYSHYFGSQCHPNLSNVADLVVNSVNTAVAQELDRQSMGLPMLDHPTVQSIIDIILKNQGCFVVGDRESSFNEGYN